jgi:hypothetical protein
MVPTPFIIIGSGWRSEFYLRIAREIPDRFAAAAMLIRDPAKAQRYETAFAVRTHRNLDDLLRSTRPLFAVVCVAKNATASVLAEPAVRKIPILCETPPAPDLAGLDQVNQLTAAGARIQVAEQYVFQPMHAARLAVARSGLLGAVSQAQVSFSQSYHGISLIRRYLGVGFDSVKITAKKFTSPIFQGPSRAGPPAEEKIIPCPQTLAWLDWGDRLGVFDFAHDQHRSYVRSDRVLIRGERGEINQTRVRHLLDFRTPMEFELHRVDAGQDGNLEGHHHKGVVGAAQWWYENPFLPARLFDDEIAVATCLEKMSVYAAGGADFYSLAEASHDMYLGLMMDQAAEEEKTIEVQPRPWAK